MSKTSCDNATEFKCISGSVKCILRSYVNNRVQDCSDGSDENVLDFKCFKYEFRCFSYIQPKNKLSESFLSYNSWGLIFSFFRCISYEKVKDGRRDCSDYTDEYHLIKNCTHNQLFLCLDQSRCLPKRLQCNGILNCIDGSDEIEGCKNSTTFGRYFLSNKTVAHDLSSSLVIFTNETYFDIINLNRNETLTRSKLFF